MCVCASGNDGVLKMDVAGSGGGVLGGFVQGVVLMEMELFFWMCKKIWFIEKYLIK